jgi:hypothetical protein
MTPRRPDSESKMYFRICLLLAKSDRLSNDWEVQLIRKEKAKGRYLSSLTLLFDNLSGWISYETRRQGLDCSYSRHPVRDPAECVDWSILGAV